MAPTQKEAKDEIIRRLDVLSHEVFGNGTPGGLKVQVALIDEKLERLLQDVLAVKDSIVKKTGQDPFIRTVGWFADKVLPALVIGFLMTFAQGFIFVVVLMFAFTSGYLTF